MDVLGSVLVGLDPAGLRVAFLVIVLYFVVTDHWRVATLWEEKIKRDAVAKAMKERHDYHSQP